MPTAERHWLKPKEFAALYAISPKHLYSLMAQGLVPATKRKGVGWLVNARLFEKQLEAGIEERCGRIQ